MGAIRLHDVGLRDGLQIEKAVVPTGQKLKWAGMLAEAGLDLVQVGSFVRPEKVPQMADTDALFSELTRGRAATRSPERADQVVLRQAQDDPEPRRRVEGRPILSALVLNEKGLDRGLACGVEYFCMGVSASETHSRRNTGMGTEEATGRIIAIARQAQQAGKGVQVSVQSAFGCGFEGVIPAARVLGIVRRFLDAGLRTVSLADTAGHAYPEQVRALFGAVLALDPAVECACHFHDTYGLALANCYAALEAGVTCFETAFAGLGGCPFTAATAGNVPTEDLVHGFQRAGRRTDIALGPLVALAREAGAFFGRELPGRVHRAKALPGAAVS
jgi:hydroxymethylglutaryl-CoA lyase